MGGLGGISTHSGTLARDGSIAPTIVVRENSLLRDPIARATLIRASAHSFAAPVLGAVLAHRRHRDPVGKGDAAEAKWFNRAGIPAIRMGTAI
jgi:hypothetical protein